MSILLNVENLQIETAGRSLVSGVSLSVGQGERVGLIGESGSGKSLTALAIMGLLPDGMRASGSITLDGHQVIGARDRELVPLRGQSIATVFQEPMTALDPLMRIGKQVGLVVRRRALRDGHRTGKTEVSAEVHSLLERVSLPDPERIARSWPHEISGGQRQRAAIAMALACRPKLLIADEPTTALDVSIQAQIITLLKDLCRSRDTAVMLVTHDMGVIAEAADRVAVMYAGRIAEIGPVADVIHLPQHPYTAGLMGSIPTIGEQRERLEQIDGAMPRPGAIPSGCAFHPRCPRVMSICTRLRPEPMPVERSLAACWLHSRRHEEEAS